jgi:hypothetical protein
MVTLEAWALGRPVVANGRCDVLRGQCLRSNAGLCYEDYPEFLAILRALEKYPGLRAALGANGRRFFHEHYDWPVIVRKYVGMFDRLRSEPARPPMEPLPSWLARKRVNLPPAEQVMATAPRGPAVGGAAPPHAAAGTRS